MANGESRKIDDLLGTGYNYSSWKNTNLSPGGGEGGWHAAKGLVKGDSLWLTTGPGQSILCRYCIQGERREEGGKKALKTSQMAFHSDIDQHLLSWPCSTEAIYFFRVYGTHKSESCYSHSGPVSSELGCCNWPFRDGGALPCFVTRIPFPFRAAGETSNDADAGKTKKQVYGRM